jgi:hypothetical protein
LYSQLSNRIENLSDSLAKKAESLSDNLVKKQEFFDSRKALWDQLQGQRKETLDGDKELRQRCISLEVQLKASDDRAKDLIRDIQVLRDTLASFNTLRDTTIRLDQQFRDSKEERARLMQDLQQVRERLASVEGQTSASTKKN